MGKGKCQVLITNTMNQTSSWGKHECAGRISLLSSEEPTSTHRPTGLITPGGKSEDANSSENTEKVDALYKELKIEENPILQENPKVKEKVKELASKFKDVFAEPGKEVGKTNLIQFDIELVKNDKPQKSRVRPLNPA